MNDLKRMEIDLLQVIRLIDDWKMNGYDTPILTYHEQLDMYNQYLDRLVKKIESMLL